MYMQASLAPHSPWLPWSPRWSLTHPPQEQSQVSFAGSHHHFSLSMVAGLASLSYAGHVCGHSGQLWSYLVLVVLVLCFVCLLLFLHNA